MALPANSWLVGVNDPQQQGDIQSAQEGLGQDLQSCPCNSRPGPFLGPDRGGGRVERQRQQADDVFVILFLQELSPGLFHGAWWTQILWGGEASEEHGHPCPNPLPLSSRFHVRWLGRQLQQLWDHQPEQLLLQVPGGEWLMGISGKELLPFKKTQNVRGDGLGFVAEQTCIGC